MRFVIILQVIAVIEWANALNMAYRHKVESMLFAAGVALFATVMSLVIARQRMHLAKESGYLSGLQYLTAHFPDLEITLKKKNEHGS